MSGEFLGVYTNSVNKQKWITIPAAFKKRFSPSSKQKLIVTIGPVGNIALFPLDNWKAKIDELKKGSQKEAQLLYNLRSFASSEQKLEDKGRIKLTNELLEISNIDDKVILKGEGSFISVWNPENYREFRRRIITEHKQMFNSIDYQM